MKDFNFEEFEEFQRWLRQNELFDEFLNMRVVCIDTTTPYLRAYREYGIHNFRDFHVGSHVRVTSIDNGFTDNIIGELEHVNGLYAYIRTKLDLIRILID